MQFCFIASIYASRVNSILCDFTCLVMFLNMLVDMVVRFLIYSDYCPLYRSGDSTARIWTLADGTSRSSSQSGSLNVLVLKHPKGKINEKNKDITTLDWNVSSLWLLLQYYAV